VSSALGFRVENNSQDLDGTIQKVWSLLEIVTELDVSGLAAALTQFDSLKLVIESYGGGELNRRDHGELVRHIAFLRQKCAAPLNLSHSLAALDRLSTWMEGLIRRRDDIPHHALVVHM
jgi:hypothetical protein